MNSLSLSSDATWAILWTALIGLVIGVLARVIRPSRQQPGREPSKGYVDSALVGIVGAFLATYSGSILGLHQVGEIRAYVAALIGAVVLSAISHFVRRGS